MGDERKGHRQRGGQRTVGEGGTNEKPFQTGAPPAFLERVQRLGTRSHSIPGAAGEGAVDRRHVCPGLVAACVWPPIRAVSDFLNFASGWRQLF
jgi:hypothetical protein